MKSIKPGRGPSMMGGIMGIFAAVFGVIWTISAATMGGGLFALFGLVFIGAAVMITVYNFKNATSKNRYSAYDITDSSEEPDPLNQRFGGESHKKSDAEDKKPAGAEFCPWCGADVSPDHVFCSKCGKSLK